jgi:nucleoside diphosphate kinase
MPSRPAVVSFHQSMCSRHATSYANGATIAILGATNPLASAPGTIRGDYAIVRSIETSVS